MTNLKTLIRVFAMLACAALLSGIASATTLQIQFLGFDFQYGTDGTNGFICSGGGGACAVDTLGLVDFLEGGVSQGSIGSGVSMVSVSFDLVGEMPLSGGSLPVGFGIFDLDFGGVNFLLIDVSGGTLTYSPGGGGITASLTGSAIGGSIFLQNLPFSLQIGDPLTVSFSGSEVAGLGVGADDGFLTSLSVSGTGEVSGESVPEPGTYALMGAGLLGLAFLRRKKA
jgi:hypothetical protein